MQVVGKMEESGAQNLYHTPLIWKPEGQDLTFCNKQN